MKKYFYLIIAWLCVWQCVYAQEEKLLYTAGFNNWSSIDRGETVGENPYTVTKITDYSKENLTFSVSGATLDNTTQRYTYTGYVRLAKNTEVNVTPFIELSKLSSVTKVVYYHGATGSNRGLGLQMKNEGDESWTTLYSTVTNGNGTLVTVNIPAGKQDNVALKFYNLAPGQYADLVYLEIYGIYTPTAPTYALNTLLNIPGAGVITRSPNATEYEEGTEVSLFASPNFGYKFLKWVDADNADAELSMSNPYIVTIDAIKNIKAVFEAVTTYNFTLNKTGSNWGKVLLSPEPVNGKYEEGTEVTMKIVPNPVTTFSYWEDNSTVLQRTVTVNADAAYTATFDEIPFIVGWNFEDQNIKQSKTGDYYAETTNTGSISAYEPNGTKVNWLSNMGSFSPSLPNIRLWTDEDKFLTDRRYVQAQFSTVGYKNIEVKSMVSANTHAYSIMTLQYSLDGNNFTELNRVDITDVFNSGWKDLNVTLPTEAEGKSMIYIRWIADATSTIIGSGKDGAALTNVYVYADKEVVNDTDAPVLLSAVPLSGSATATINGAVVLTFNERVKAGTGNITIGSTVLSGVYGAKSVTLAYEKLSYNTTYTVTVPASAITDMSGNPYPGTTFSFTTANRLPPAKKLFDAVVAQDGSGDYLSVKEAIDAAPISRANPWLIYIKNGKYIEHLDIPVNKPFIHLIGQSRNGVIISDNKLSGKKDPDDGTPVYHVSQGATVVVNSTDCYFENLTLENSWGYEQLAGPQALALYSNNDRFTLNNVYLRSYQDTYLTSTKNIADRHYVRGSRIEGAVDFIYGAGDVFFDKDTIAINRADGGYIVAPSHRSETTFGYVFSDCYLMKDRVANVMTYLGRPWQNAPKTVFLNTRLLAGVSIYPKGWHYKMGAIPAIFADYNTMDANGSPIDLNQRIEDYEYDVKDTNGNVISVVSGKAKKSLTTEEAGAYTYENVILRTGDIWDPRLMTEAPEKPSNLALNSGQLTWNEVDYARLYIIFRDNNVIGFSLNGSYTDATAANGTNYAYKVQAVGEYGALSAASNPVQTLPISGLSVKATKVGQSVQISWTTLTEKGTSHFIVERTLDGKVFDVMGERKAVGDSNIKQDYYFTDNTPAAGINIYRIKAVDFDGHVDYSEFVSVKFAENMALKVYPNPVSDLIHISIPSKEIMGLNIYDLKGRKVISAGKSSASSTSIDVAALPAGMYLLKVNDGETQSTVRFVKK